MLLRLAYQSAYRRQLSLLLLPPDKVFRLHAYGYVLPDGQFLLVNRKITVDNIMERKAATVPFVHRFHIVDKLDALLMQRLGSLSIVLGVADVDGLKGLFHLRKEVGLGHFVRVKLQTERRQANLFEP